MFCGNCGVKMDEDTNHCAKCGWVFPITPELTCSACGAILKEDATFCGNCGNKINILTDNQYQYKKGLEVFNSDGISFSYPAIYDVTSSNRIDDEFCFLGIEVFKNIDLLYVKCNNVEDNSLEILCVRNTPITQKQYIEEFSEVLNKRLNPSIKELGFFYKLMGSLLIKSNINLPYNNSFNGIDCISIDFEMSSMGIRN